MNYLKKWSFFPSWIAYSHSWVNFLKLAVEFPWYDWLLLNVCNTFIIKWLNKYMRWFSDLHTDVGIWWNNHQKDDVRSFQYLLMLVFSLLAGMTNLKELDLSRCSKITDAGIEHLLTISALQKLCISETCVTSDGVARLCSLTNLLTLDLGGLCVSDSALSSLQVEHFKYAFFYLFYMFPYEVAAASIEIFYYFIHTSFTCISIAM